MVSKLLVEAVSETEVEDADTRLTLSALEESSWHPDNTTTGKWSSGGTAQRKKRGDPQQKIVKRLDKATQMLHIDNNSTLF